jgi:hypothetical protein
MFLYRFWLKLEIILIKLILTKKADFETKYGFLAYITKEIL